MKNSYIYYYIIIILENSIFQDYENDIKLWRKILTSAIKKKKGHLCCEKCGTIKRSVNGFISHMQFCGKSEEVCTIFCNY